MKNPIVSPADVKAIDRVSMQTVLEKFPVYAHKEDLSLGRGQGRRRGKMVMGGMATVGLSVTIHDLGAQFGVAGEDLNELKLMSGDSDGPSLLKWYAKARYYGFDHGQSAAYAYMMQDNAAPEAIADIMSRQAEANPIAPLFDTANPPDDPDRALGYAGVYDDRRQAIKAWHITNDAERTMELIEGGMPLIEMGGENKELRELGPGLYMSAVPQLWMGRATKKWEFLEHLDEGQRLSLADALGRIVLEQRQTGYITESEYKRANRDLELYVDDANVGCVIQLAGQPHNIGFWKPDFLKPLGIKPGPEPEVIEFLIQGIFAGFDNQPQQKEIEGLIMDEFDGCFLRGGLVNIAQMVVWRNEAIVGMKNGRL